MSEEEIIGEKFRLVFNKDINIYENKEALSRAFIISKVKVMKDESEVRKVLLDEHFNPQKEIILEDDTDFVETNSSGSTARIINYSPNEVVIAAELTAEGFLIPGDTYYPGWKVYVNGMEENIYRADYILRAVRLSRGRHTIRFVYDPLSFKVGLYISGCTAWLIALSLIILR